MGKKAAKAGDVPAVADQKVLMPKVRISQVGLVDQGLEVTQIEGLPEEFKRGETLSGFPPSPEWKNPGDAIFGYFVKQREKIGPNESRLYELAVPRKDEEPLTVAVWGSAALDRLVDSAFPPLKSGDKVAIIFLGEKPTKRGLNPVKLFALKIVRPDGKAQTTQAA
jgi:hypothetical protein